MELKITEEKKNPLFERKEIQATFEGKIVPSYAEITKKISEKYSVPEENIKIKKVSGKFGSKEFMIKASIYNSKEAKENIEIKPKEKKK